MSDCEYMAMGMHTAQLALHLLCWACCARLCPMILADSPGTSKLSPVIALSPQRRLCVCSELPARSLPSLRRCQKAHVRCGCLPLASLCPAGERGFLLAHQTLCAGRDTCRRSGRDPAQRGCMQGHRPQGQAYSQAPSKQLLKIALLQGAAQSSSCTAARVLAWRKE